MLNLFLSVVIIVGSVGMVIFGVRFLMGKGINRQALLERNPNWKEEDIRKSARTRGIIMIVLAIVFFAYGVYTLVTSLA